MPDNPIRPTIPLDADGVHHGHLRLPHSRDESAWGSIMIPVTVVKNGEGPTALLTGAAHGDEYEGPLALFDLAATLSPADVRGRVIVVPAFNFPAFRAGRRVSPIDQCNLNRIFPGRPDGSPSEKIADFFVSTLVPLADIVLDFHSGGKTLDFVPFAAAHVLEDKAQEARCRAAVRAFGAPYTLMLKEIDDAGMYDTAVEALGKTFVTTELGGGGTTTARSVAIARRGVRNVLKHAGILEGEPEIGPTTRLDVPGDDCFVFSEHDGLLEPRVNLADPVRAGDLLARIWRTDRTGAPPVDYHAPRPGILVSRHFPGLVGTGDCLAVLADACPS